MEIAYSSFSFLSSSRICAWMVTSSARDHHTLQHTAGQLVRVAAVNLLRILQLYIRQGFECFFPSFRLIQIRMNAEDFCDLFSDPHQRVHGAHRFLKNNADFPAVQLSQFAALRMQKVPSVQQDIAGIAALLSRKQLL